MASITFFCDACKGVEDCGICIYVCPKGLFEPSDRMNARGFLVPRLTDERQCTRCQNCMISCPDMAIMVEKEQNEEKVES